MVLNNRDIATLVWLAVLLAWVARSPSVRASLLGVGRSFAQPKLLLVFVLYGLWMVAVVAVAAVLGLWNAAMLRDTVVAVVVGLAIVTGAAGAASQPGFFRRRVKRAVAVTVFLEVYLNLATLDLVWELVLQPVLFVLVLMSAVAGRTDGAAAVKRLTDWALPVIGLIVLVPPTVLLLTQRGQLDTVQTLRDFALPVWMVMGVVPFAYGFAVVAAYETVLIRLKWFSPDKRVPSHVVTALVREYGLDYVSLATHVPRVSWQLVRTSSSVEAVLVARAARRTVTDGVAHGDEADDTTDDTDSSDDSR